MAFKFAPSSGTGGFSFGGSAAPAPTSAAPASSGGFSFGGSSAPAPAPTAPASTGGFSFGGSAAPAPAPAAPAKGGGFSFGGSAAPAPATATAPASGGGFSFGGSAAAAPAPAPATAAAPASGFSFGSGTSDKKEAASKPTGGGFSFTGGTSLAAPKDSAAKTPEVKTLTFGKGDTTSQPASLSLGPTSKVDKPPKAADTANTTSLTLPVPGIGGKTTFGGVSGASGFGVTQTAQGKPPPAPSLGTDFAKELEAVDFSESGLLTRLNDHQIYQHLEQSNDAICSPGDIATIFSTTSEALKRIKMLLGYYCGPSDSAKTQLQSGQVPLFPNTTAVKLPGRDLEKKFLMALSATLKLDEVQTAQCFHAFMRQYFVGNVRDFSASDFQSTLLLTQVRDFYFTQRVYQLRTLQELLRIDQDPEHPYYDPAVHTLDSVLPGDYASKVLLSQFKDLLQPVQLPLRDNCICENIECSPLEEKHFFADTRKAWELQRSVEISELVNCLILLFYTRVQVNRTLLHDVLSTAREGLLFQDQRLRNKICLMAIESFQLWRLLPQPQEQMEDRKDGTHPLLANEGSLAQEIDALQELIWEKLRSDAQGDLVAGAPLQSTIILAWGLFLFLGKEFSKPLKQWVTADRDKAACIEANELGAFSVLEGIINEVLRNVGPIEIKSLPDPYTKEYAAEPLTNPSGHPDLVAYCSVLKELLSCVVWSFYGTEERITHRKLQGDELLMLVNLVSTIYKGQVELCRNFWALWHGGHEGEEDICSEPLCLLLEAALAVYSYNPLPALRLLTALCGGDSDNAQQAFALLLEWGGCQGALVLNAHITPAESLLVVSQHNTLVPLAHNPEPGTVFYLGTGIRDPTSGIEIPVHTKGTFLGMEADVPLISWEAKYSALAVLMHRLESFGEVSSGVAASEADVELVCAVMELLSAFFTCAPALPNLLRRHMWTWKIEEGLTAFDLSHLVPLLLSSQELHPLQLSRLTDEEMLSLGIENYPERQALRSQELAARCTTRSLCLRLPEIVCQLLARQFHMGIAPELNPMSGGQNQGFGHENLLTGALVLAGALCQATAPWPAGVMAAFLNHFHQQDQDAVAQLLHLTSSLECHRGWYPITSAGLGLFSSLMAYAMAPRASPDLHLVFSLLDANGDGRISGADLLVSVAGMGHLLSRDAEEIVFQFFEEEGASTMSYRTFVALVRWSEGVMRASTQSAADNEPPATPSETELAWAIMMYIKAAQSTQQREAKFCSQMVEFSLNVAVWSEGWRFVKEDERWHVALAALQTVRAALAPPIQKKDVTGMQELQYATLKRIVTDTHLHSRILSLAVVLATSSMQNSLRGVMAGVVRRMGDLRFSGLFQQKCSNSAVLPVDFSKGVLGTSSPDDLCMLLLVAKEGLRLVECILESCFELGASNPLSNAAVSMLLQQASTPTGLVGVIGTGAHHSSPTPLGCTYALTLAAHLTLPKTRARAVHLSSLTAQAVRVITLAARCSGQVEGSRPLLEATGPGGIVELSGKVMADISSPSVPIFLRMAFTDLILTALSTGQIALATALLLGKDSPSSDTKSEDSALSALITLLGLKLYHYHPELAAKSLRLIHALWEQPLTTRLGIAVSKLSQKSEFWTELCKPLLEELEEPPLRSAMMDDVETTESTTIGAHCHRLQVHSILLQILAIEQHGALQSVGGEKESIPHKEVNRFLRKASENQYAHWMKAYMRFDYDPKVITHLQEASKEAGIPLEEFWIPPTQRDFGDRYVYNIQALEQYLSQGQRVDIAEGLDLPVHLVDEELAKTMVLANRCWSIGDTQSQLIRSWRVFMEVCVFRRQPGYIPNTGLDAQPPEKVPTLGSPSHSWNVPQTPLLSPSLSLTSPSQSAITPKSDFRGDLRSYTMALEVGRWLSNENRGGLGVAEVCEEMSDLLVSMVHHQLHEVLQKAANPGQTITQPRGSGRMKADKMHELLSMVELACTQLFGLFAPGATPLAAQTPADDEDLRSLLFSMNIHLRLRLLTTVLLLLRGLLQRSKAGIRSLDSDGTLGQICTRLFAHACDTISMVDSTKSLDLPLEENGSDYRYQLMSVCISLLNFLIEIQPELQNITGTEWLMVLKEKDLVPLLISYFTTWCQSAVDPFKRSHQYFRTFQSKEKKSASNQSSSDPSHEASVDRSLKPNVNITRVQVVLTLLVTFAHSPLVAPELVQANLCHVFNRNPLFAEIMRTSTTLPPAHAHMHGYQGNGERSPYYTCWDLAISVVQGLWSSLGSRGLVAGTRQDPYSELCALAAAHCGDFVLYFHPLLAVPLNSKRWTIAALEDSATTLHLLSTMESYFSANTPSFWRDVVMVSKGLSQRFSLLLGGGMHDKHERIYHHEYLHNSCIAVSEEEHRNEHLDASSHRFKRQGGRDPLAGKKGFGTSKTRRTALLLFHSNFHPTGTAAMMREESDPALATKDVKEGERSSTPTQVVKRNPSLNKEFNLLFHLQLEYAVCQALASVIEIVQSVTSIPDQLVRFTPEEACKIRLPPGTKVLVDGTTGEELRGVIVKYSSNGYAIRFANGIVEGIRATRILAAKESEHDTQILYEYRCLSEIHYPPDPSHPLEAVEVPPSIGHLLLLHKYMIIHLKDIRSIEESSSVDEEADLIQSVGDVKAFTNEMKLLTEKISYLIVLNVLHHESNLTVPLDHTSRKEIIGCMEELLENMEQVDIDIEFLQYLRQCLSDQQLGHSSFKVQDEKMKMSGMSLTLMSSPSLYGRKDSLIPAITAK